MFVKYFVLLLVFCTHTLALFDPISIGIGGAILGGLYKYKRDAIKEYTYCQVYECCNDHYIKNDLRELSYEIEHSLFGQHLVKNTLIAALRSHVQGDPKKPLVISFHGTTGTGKNYVSEMIIKHLYREGSKSQYVHKFGIKDFANLNSVSVYRTVIVNKIENAIKSCPQSLFIFDEVEKYPPGIFNDMVTYLEHHNLIDGYDYRRAIYILLSNSLGSEIGDRLIGLMETGKMREDVQLNEFEKDLLLGTYNVDGSLYTFSGIIGNIVRYYTGGLQQSYLIDSSLIDHFVPFLPLEKQHIKLCIQAEFRRQRGRWPTDSELSNVEDNAISYTGIFSSTGCKRISSKVPLV